MKRILILGAGALLGSFLYESFIAQGDDGRGFVPQAPGFGVDDVVRALVTGGAIVVTSRALGKIV